MRGRNVAIVRKSFCVRPQASLVLHTLHLQSRIILVWTFACVFSYLAQNRSSRSNYVRLFVQSCLGSLRTVILFEFKILVMSVPDLRISGLRIKMCLGVSVRSGDATHYPGSGDTPTLRGLAPIINTSHIVLVNRLHLTWNAFLFFTMCFYPGLSAVRKRHYLFLLYVS